jgi:hypothetical protein
MGKGYSPPEGDNSEHTFSGRFLLVLQRSTHQGFAPLLPSSSPLLRLCFPLAGLLYIPEEVASALGEIIACPRNK